MALEFTEPLLCGEERTARNADNLAAICELTAYKISGSRRITTLQGSTAC
jgi:hypothetical protein